MFGGNRERKAVHLCYAIGNEEAINNKHPVISCA